MLSKKMPYFAYQGIDVYGNRYSGKKIVPSIEHLKKMLFNEGIALLGVKKKKILTIHFIKEKQKINFYKYLGQLLTAGILLPEALEHIALNTNHVFLQNI